MRTRLFTAAALVAGCALATGCGSPAPAATQADSTAGSGPAALAAAAAMRSGAQDAVSVPVPGSQLGEVAPAAPRSSQAASTPPAGEAVDALPLRRGYYVATDTPCAKASNATLMLVTRDGVSASRSSCEMLGVTRTNARRFVVRERCDGEDMTTTYDIPADDRFTTTSESGWTSSARFCPQASLPEPWRDNDISDVTG